MNLSARIEKIERQCGVGDDREEILDFGDGQRYRIKRSRLEKILRDIAASPTSRLLPGGGSARRRAECERLGKGLQKGQME